MTRARALSHILWVLGSPMGDAFVDDLQREPEIFDDEFVSDLGVACKRLETRVRRRNRDRALWIKRTPSQSTSRRRT
jgi:hypothetical protein